MAPGYLDSQISAFKSSVSSSSNKLANRKTVAGSASSTATPPPATQTTKGELKRKYVEDNVTYSQPQDTGTGKNIMTQVTYAVDYLRDKKTPMNLTDIVSHLSMQHKGVPFRRTLNQILLGHTKVQYERKGDGGEGTFRFRPVHNIHSKDTLLAHLQSQRSAQGLNVRELLDGWPTAYEEVDELAREQKVLVTRVAKDNRPKMVWANDPSLSYDIDDEFKSIWHKISLPEASALADELEKVQLMPANKSRNLKKPVKQETKKKRAARKGGKVTNTHLPGLLRDYSHMKKK